MNCEELRDHYELFVLGVAEEPEAAEIREHLGRSCITCAAGVKSARELTTLMATSAPSATPSAGLRRRIVASVSPDAPLVVTKSKSSWWAGLLAGAMAVVAIGFYVVMRNELEKETQLRIESARLEAQLISQTTQLARMNEALAILNNTETIEVNFGPNQQRQPAGKVFVSPQRGVLFIASQLPAAPAGKTYEMWIVPKQGGPVPAGLFQSGSDGTALHVQQGPVDLATSAAVAVTLENAGGSATPTPPILIAAALPSQRPAR